MSNKRERLELVNSDDYRMFAGITNMILAINKIAAIQDDWGIEYERITGQRAYKNGQQTTGFRIWKLLQRSH